MELAKVQIAGSLGYFFRRKHFPPGVKLDIREDIYPKWKCSTCGKITPYVGIQILAHETMNLRRYSDLHIGYSMIYEGVAGLHDRDSVQGNVGA
jgi:hypothetical protein